MKLSIDRQEQKGPFGGAYYVTSVVVSLTPEEEAIAKRQKALNGKLLGGSIESKEGSALYELCGEPKITMQNLMCGIRAKVPNGKMLGKLVDFEDSIRASCKNFKSLIEADSFFGGGGSTSEEVF